MLAYGVALKDSGPKKGKYHTIIEKLSPIVEA